MLFKGKHLKSYISLAAFVVGCLHAQTAGPQSAGPLETFHFLEGTWEAKTAAGPSAPAVSGTYFFRRELGGHVLARHSNTAACKGPSDFDCDHGDLLYVYSDGEGQPLKAIYFDNEGHVIHYDVSAPTPTKAVFLSSAATPGPRFQLIYELRGNIMSGKFQMQLPGQPEWKSYLEWSGPKK